MEKSRAIPILLITVLALSMLVVNIPRKTLALEGWNNHIVITYRYTGSTPLTDITLFLFVINESGDSKILNETKQSFVSNTSNIWVKIPYLYLDGLADTNFSDIRITDYQGNLLPMYVEKINSTWAIVYFRVPSISANSEFDIILWYNNPNAEPWSGELPFYEFEDFEGDFSDWYFYEAYAGTTASFDGGNAIKFSCYSIGETLCDPWATKTWDTKPPQPKDSIAIVFEGFVWVSGKTYGMFGGLSAGTKSSSSRIQLGMRDCDSTCGFILPNKEIIFGGVNYSQESWRFYRIMWSYKTSEQDYFLEVISYDVRYNFLKLARKLTDNNLNEYQLFDNITFQVMTDTLRYSKYPKSYLDKVRAYITAIDPPIEPVSFSYEASPPTGASVYEDGTFSLDNEGCTRYRVYSDYDSSINSYTVNGVANAYGEYGVEGRLKNITFNVLLDTSQSSIDYYLKYLYKDQVLVYAYGLNDYVYVEINDYNGYPIGSYSKYSPDNYTLNLVITYNYVNMVVHITEDTLGIDVQLTLKGDYVFDPQYSVRVKWVDSGSSFTYYVYDRTYEGKITGLEFYIGNYQLVKVYDNVDNITVVISRSSGNINITSKDLVYFEVYYDNGYKVVIGNSYGGKKTIDTGRTVIDNFGGSITVEGKMYYSSECSPPSYQGGSTQYSTSEFNTSLWVVLIIVAIPLFIFGFMGLPIVIGLLILFGLLDIIPLWIPIGVIIAFSIYLMFKWRGG